MNKKIFLLSAVLILCFAYQNASASASSLSLLPSSVEINTGANLDLSVKLNPLGNKVCVVKGTLNFTKLSCKNISITSGLIAQTSPTCASPSFNIGIPGCATDVKDIMAASVLGGVEGSANITFSDVKIIGAGTNLEAIGQNGSYVVKAVVVTEAVVEIPQVQTPKPVQTTQVAKTTSATPAEQPEQKEPEIIVQNIETIIPEGSATASTFEKMKNFLASPVTIGIIIAIILLLTGIWVYERFLKKPKVEGQ